VKQASPHSREHYLMRWFSDARKTTTTWPLRQKLHDKFLISARLLCLSGEFLAAEEIDPEGCFFSNKRLGGLDGEKRECLVWMVSLFLDGWGEGLFFFLDGGKSLDGWERRPFFE
jgi:hypothetical protein